MSADTILTKLCVVLRYEALGLFKVAIKMLLLDLVYLTLALHCNYFESG